MSLLRRSLLSSVLVLALGATWLAAWAWQRYESAPIGMKGDSVRLTLARGTNVRGVARELARQGVTVPGWLVVAAARLRGDDARIKSGVYQIGSATTLREFLDKLVRGEVLLKEIRFIEGGTFRQMRDALAREPELIHDSQGLSDSQLLDRLGIRKPNAEGLFFPSTYLFSPGSGELELLRQANRQMLKVLDDAWAQRAPGLPLAEPYQVLILASVVEKETGRDGDRDKVAAVFVNRLRIGMRLQSDPTVIYGMGERFDGDLRRRDLLADTPFNTYTRAGLPPTPIALPGKASIVAVTQPADTDALYFVARGDGSSEFSKDLAAHNRAVNRYQRGRP